MSLDIDNTFGSANLTFEDVSYIDGDTRPKFIGEGRYVMGRVIGEGSYSKVREGIDVKQLRRVAVKICNFGRLRHIRDVTAQFRREIANLRALQGCSHVVGLLEAFPHPHRKNKWYAVFEYVGGGTLHDLIKTAPGGKLTVPPARFLFRQCIVGLAAVHALGIVHRDIKPENMLVSPLGILNISDFGLSEKLDYFVPSDEVQISFGSPAFLPPQIAAGGDKLSGFKGDVWAAGVTLWLMLAGELPFTGNTFGELMDNIEHRRLVFPEELRDASLLELLAGMLEKDETKRWDTATVLSCKWMKETTAEEDANDVAKLLPHWHSEVKTNRDEMLQFVAMAVGNDESSYEEDDAPKKKEKKCAIL